MYFFPPVFFFFDAATGDLNLTFQSEYTEAVKLHFSVFLTTKMDQIFLIYLFAAP